MRYLGLSIARKYRKPPGLSPEVCFRKPPVTDPEACFVLDIILFYFSDKHKVPDRSPLYSGPRRWN